MGGSGPSSESAFDRALQAHLAGDLAAAKTGYEATLKADPQHAGALANLGRIARAGGDHLAALSLYRRAAEAPGAPAEVFFNLGSAAADLGRTDDALAALEEAVSRAPGLAPALAKLGGLLFDLGRFEDAAARAEAAHAAAPGRADVAELWARVSERRGDAAAAEAAYRRSLAALRAQGRGAAPALRRVRIRLAQCLLSRGDGDGAVALAEEVARDAPNDAAAAHNLGYAYRSAGHYAKAAQQFTAALRLAPQSIDTALELANCLVNTGAHDAAEQIFTKVLETEAGRKAATGAYLMSRLYRSEISPITVRSEHERLTAAWPSAPRPDARYRGAGRLKVGYLTADIWGAHPVAQFLAPILERHGAHDVESVVYLNRPTLDATVERFRGRAAFRMIQGLSDDDAAALISGDELDLLVDLSGHTSANRLRVLGRRPAPRQACFIGYPGTTGFRPVDFLIADARLIPPQSEHLYSERIARLPHSFLCFTPPPGMPTPEPVAAAGGPVTFGSLSHLPKLGPETVRLWARVLRAVPGARLLLKCAAFAEDPPRNALAAAFAAEGVAPERLSLEGPSPFAEAMARYNAIDIALDPVPYNGGTTSCHALWMGRPLVSLEGAQFCGRMGASVLHAAGRAEWLAADEDAYVRTAAALAETRAAAAAASRALLADAPNSPLCDADAYAADVAALFRRIASDA